MHHVNANDLSKNKRGCYLLRKVTTERKIKDFSIAFIAIMSFYALLAYMGVRCPIKFLYGISCPGCGMTRAYCALLRCDLKEAFFYHPLWIIPLVWILLWIGKEMTIARGSTLQTVKRVNGLYIWFCRAAVISFFIVYFIRLQNETQEIVVFNPAEGFIFRWLKGILI